MAHKKGSGSTKNGRDSNSKRLGVKKYGGGSKFKAGSNVKRSKDDTLFALIPGIVKFEIVDKNRKKISIYPKFYS